MNMLGRFIPGESLIHHLDVRTKLLISFLFMLVLFANQSWPGYLVLIGFVLLTARLSRLPAKTYWQGLKGIMLLVMLTLFLQLFFTTGQPVYWHWGFLQLTGTGIINAIAMLIRFILIILMTTILTATTEPVRISDGLESLMKPLKKIHVPVAELALMLSIALRFVPIINDEAQQVMSAQRARGINFNQGGLIKRAKAIVPIIIPLIMGAFNKALDLADAMTVRGFVDAEHRTRYHQLAYQRRDYFAFAAFVGLIVLVGVFNYFKF